MKTPILHILACLLGLTAFAAGKWLDDYVSAPEDVFDYYEVPNSTYSTNMGSTVYQLNVTSLTYLDTTKAVGPQGSTWSHTALVIVPKNLKHDNVSLAVLTGEFCNEVPNVLGKDGDYDVSMADQVAASTGAIVTVIKEIPNCHIVFPSDPEQKRRHEDSFLAWTFKEFLDSEDHNPEWLGLAVMTKAAHQVMKASQDYINKSKLGNVQHWMSTGVSKRGWTTWLVGAVNCSTCVDIIGLVPIVPIVPPFDREIHYQWQSYGGFSFAFKDYNDAGLLQRFDEPLWYNATQVIDPQFYFDRLARLPKHVIVASDDQFMQFDWTQMWYGKMPGETHLTITPNVEHTELEGLYSVMMNMATFVRSIITQTPGELRPTFNTTYDEEAQTVEVTIPEEYLPLVEGVYLRHAETLQNKRRDFRWMIAANNKTDKCIAPAIKMKKKDLCFQTIFWKQAKMEKQADYEGHYKISVPQPQKGLWMGFYAQVYFKGEGPKPEDGILENAYHKTSMGWVTPDVMPYPPCEGQSCTSTML